VRRPAGSFGEVTLGANHDHQIHHAFLWFNDQAEDAANYYVSLFPNSKIKQVSALWRCRPRSQGQCDGGEL